MSMFGRHALDVYAAPVNAGDGGGDGELDAHAHPRAHNHHHPHHDGGGHRVPLESEIADSNYVQQIRSGRDSHVTETRRDDSLAAILHDEASHNRSLAKHHEEIFAGRHRDVHPFVEPLNPHQVAQYNSTHHKTLHARPGDVVPTDDVYVDEVGARRIEAEKNERQRVVPSDLSGHELPAFIPGKSITNAQASETLGRTEPQHATTDKELQDQFDAGIKKIMLPNSVFQGVGGDYSFLNPTTPLQHGHPGTKGVVNELVETNRDLEIFARVARGKARHHKEPEGVPEAHGKEDARHGTDAAPWTRETEEEGGDGDARMPQRRRPSTQAAHHDNAIHPGEHGHSGFTDTEFAPGKHVKLVHAVRASDLDLKPLRGHNDDIELAGAGRDVDERFRHSQATRGDTASHAHGGLIVKPPQTDTPHVRVESMTDATDLGLHPGNKHSGYFESEEAKYQAMHRQIPSCMMIVQYICEVGRSYLLLLLFVGVGIVVMIVLVTTDASPT